MAYLIAALQSIKPEIGAEALLMLGSSQTVVTETILTALLSDITFAVESIIDSESSSAKLTLVLDDYHFIYFYTSRVSFSLKTYNQVAIVTMTHVPAIYEETGRKAKIGTLADLCSSLVLSNTPDRTRTCASASGGQHSIH